jgi:hypothetical protein
LVQCIAKSKRNFLEISYCKDLLEVGGGSLLHSKYNSSIFLLLSKVFPEYEWLPWKFANTPKNIWSDEKNVRNFLDWAGKQLGVKEMADWRSVTTKVLFFLFSHFLLFFSHFFNTFSLLFP